MQSCYRPLNMKYWCELMPLTMWSGSNTCACVCVSHHVCLLISCCFVRGTISRKGSQSFCWFQRVLGMCGLFTAVHFADPFHCFLCSGSSCRKARAKVLWWHEITEECVPSDFQFWCIFFFFCLCCQLSQFETYPQRSCWPLQFFF